MDKILLIIALTAMSFSYRSWSLRSRSKVRFCSWMASRTARTMNCTSMNLGLVNVASHERTNLSVQTLPLHSLGHVGGRNWFTLRESTNLTTARVRGRSNELSSKWALDPNFVPALEIPPAKVLLFWPENFQPFYQLLEPLHKEQ